MIGIPTRKCGNSLKDTAYGTPTLKRQFSILFLLRYHSVNKTCGYWIKRSMLAESRPTENFLKLALRSQKRTETCWLVNYLLRLALKIQTPRSNYCHGFEVRDIRTRPSIRSLSKPQSRIRRFRK